MLLASLLVSGCAQNENFSMSDYSAQKSTPTKIPTPKSENPVLEVDETKAYPSTASPSVKSDASKDIPKNGESTSSKEPPKEKLLIETGRTLCDYLIIGLGAGEDYPEKPEESAKESLRRAQALEEAVSMGALPDSVQDLSAIYRSIAEAERATAEGNPPTNKDTLYKSTRGPVSDIAKYFNQECALNAE